MISSAFWLNFTVRSFLLINIRRQFSFDGSFAVAVQPLQDGKSEMKKVNTRILIADDDPGMRDILELLLREWGYETESARDGQEALAKAEKWRPAVVISDVVMPKLDGLDLLRALKKSVPRCEIILITAQGSIDSAVIAMKEGAADYITKPIDHKKLKVLIEKTLERTGALDEAEELEEHLKKRGIFGRLVGMTRSMQEVFKLIKDIASSNVSVVITGERGTGKELAARTIHDLSPRHDKPFIAINCSAIPETLIESELFGHEKGAFTGATETRIGCFEMAHRGVLFLDEIAEMPQALQPKLLRVIEDGRVRRLGGKQEFEFDVRLIAATNRDPEEVIKNGQLRADLFDRLNVFTIKMPTLRERKEDISLLAQFFINELNKKHSLQVRSISPQARELLLRYGWPGNVRELRNVVERAMILCKGDIIEAHHLPPYLQKSDAASTATISIPLGVSAREAEKMLILKTLEMTGNNKAEAARILGVDVKTIRNKLKSFGIIDEEEDQRERAKAQE